MGDHQENTSDKTLFVRGLSYNTTDTQLEDGFSDYGPIKTCFTVKSKGKADKCRGFGYVIYCTRDDAVKALEGIKNINGRKVQVSFAAKRQPKKTKRQKANIDNEEECDISAKKLKLDAVDTSETATTTVPQKRGRRRDSLTVSVRSSTAVLTGLPSGVTKKQIYKRCRKVGDVTNITYLVDGRDSDTALVQYSNHQVATAAISALNGKIFKGSTLSAVLLIKESKKVSKKTLKRSRLIVRNLKFECSEETLHELFSKYGKIIEIQIPTKEDGRRIGCAFIQYSSVFDASRAIKQMNGQDIQGRVVAVDWVVPKSQYEEAKLASVQDSDADDDGDEIQNSHSADEQKSGTEQSGQEDQADDDNDDDISSEDDDAASYSDAEDSDKPISEQSEDDEKSEKLAEDKVKTSHRKKKMKNDVAEGRTIFIRNLSFDTDEDDLYDMFSEFGDISYCRIVVNQQTGLSKGTGFIQFKSNEAAQCCITAANKTDGKGLYLDGRQLNVTVAISREDAVKIKITNDEKKKVDKRNLYLAKEGTMDLQSQEAKLLSKSELVKRQRAASEKKAKLANPNYFVSKTRVCIRNLAASVAEKQLRDVLIKHVKGTPGKIKQVKIMRSKDRINSQGIGRSMGYGFVEFTTHEAALSVVRSVSNNPSVFGPHRIPIVEFALENARAVNLRKERLKRQIQFKSQRNETSSTPVQLKKQSEPRSDKPEVASHKKFRKRKIIKKQ